MLMMAYLLILWGTILITFMAIGGFFMFRKFLKSMPKQGGKSDLDWELYYVEKTKKMWQTNEKSLLEELVSPVPQLFRDVARQKIAGKIGEVALNKCHHTISREDLIEGYIIATPKRDHRFLRKKLAEKAIDVTPYEHFFALSPEDYRRNREKKQAK